MSKNKKNLSIVGICYVNYLCGLYIGSIKEMSIVHTFLLILLGASTYWLIDWLTEL